MAEPRYREDPQHYAGRKRELDGILKSFEATENAGQMERMSHIGLASLFAMETVE